MDNEKKTNQKQREAILRHLQGDYNNDTTERLTDDHILILEHQYQRQAITETLESMNYKTWFKNSSNFWRYSNAYNEIRVSHEYDDLLQPYINKDNETLIADLQEQVTIWKSFAEFLANGAGDGVEYDDGELIPPDINRVITAWNHYMDFQQDWMEHGYENMYNEWKNIDITQL